MDYQHVRLSDNSKQNQKNYLDYETWREIAYYEFINNQIIKTKICPNFVNMYGYTTSYDVWISDTPQYTPIAGFKIQ